MDDVSAELSNFLKFLTDGRPVDEFTERLVEAVETARNNKMWEVEYKAFYANQRDAYEEGHETGLEEGLKEGRQEGIYALVKTLKPILKDFDQVYDAVVQNEAYADFTREDILKYYQMVP